MSWPKNREHDEGTGLRIFELVNRYLMVIVIVLSTLLPNASVAEHRTIPIKYKAEVSRLPAIVR
jgi:hypothetical protein